MINNICIFIIRGLQPDSPAALHLKRDQLTLVCNHMPTCCVLCSLCWSDKLPGIILLIIHQILLIAFEHCDFFCVVLRVTLFVSPVKPIKFSASGMVCLSGPHIFSDSTLSYNLGSSEFWCKRRPTTGGGIAEAAGCSHC